MVEVYRRLSADLYCYFLKRTESAETAEDLTQETFVRLMGYLKEGKGVANAQGFLFRTARNLLVDHYRTRRTVEQVPELIDDSQERAREEETRREIAGWMERYVSGLPEPYRTVVDLRDLRGLSYAHIAAELEISAGTVKSRVHRGRKLLKDRLVSCCRFAFDARGRVMDYEPLRRVCRC